GNTLEDFALFRRFNAEGLLVSRATVMIGIDALPQLVDAGLAPFSGDERVRLGSVKIIVHESRGALYPEPDELAEMVWQAHRHGFQLALHAVEEGAVCVALNAIEQAQRRRPRADHRHRIETGTPLHLQDRLALRDALALFTSAGAWVGFEEARKGRIMPGMLADLVVLERDLLTVPTEEIHSLKVETTIVGGRVVWSKEMSSN